MPGTPSASFAGFDLADDERDAEHDDEEDGAGECVAVALTPARAPREVDVRAVHCLPRRSRWLAWIIRMTGS